MHKRRADMTPEELEAVRAYDREYWHRIRKHDIEYMELKRENDRRRMQTWYPNNREVQLQRTKECKAKRKVQT